MLGNRILVFRSPGILPRLVTEAPVTSSAELGTSRLSLGLEARTHPELEVELRFGVPRAPFRV